MTNYITNPTLVVGDKYLADQTWYKDAVFNSLGKFEYPLKYNDQTKVQMNKVIAQQAKIRKGIEKEYPDASKSQLKSLVVTPFWFTGKVDMTHAQYEDFGNGNPRIATEINAQIDSVNFALNEDLRDWFGFGPTSGTDVNYQEEWLSMWHLRSTADSSIGDPADMIGKCGGSSGAQLDLTAVVLWSASTNASIDFPHALLDTIMVGFEAFTDSNNGRRMVDMNGNDAGVMGYTMYVDLPVIRKLKNTHPYDGEKFDQKANIYDMLVAYGVTIIPYVGLGYSFAEDGEINFILTVNNSMNFKAGICKALTWTPWVPTKAGLKPDWERGMDVRYLPFIQPYFDGTNFYKASVYGKFKYKNDV